MKGMSRHLVLQAGRLYSLQHSLRRPDTPVICGNSSVSMITIPKNTLSKAGTTKLCGLVGHDNSSGNEGVI